MLCWLNVSKTQLYQATKKKVEQQKFDLGEQQKNRISLYIYVVGLIEMARQMLQVVQIRLFIETF